MHRSALAKLHVAAVKSRTPPTDLLTSRYRRKLKRADLPETDPAPAVEPTEPDEELHADP
jgi:hypothetical protein